MPNMNVFMQVGKHVSFNPSKATRRVLCHSLNIPESCLNVTSYNYFEVSNL